MAAKPKLDIFGLLSAVDRKDYSHYDNLSVDEKKSFSAYMLLKWSATVEGDSVLQHYYIASMNHHANKHMFDIIKHPKLQWLTIVAGSPKFGKQRHAWMSPKSTPVTKAKKDIIAMLKVIHPTYKDDEIKLLSTLVTKKELTQYKKDCGN